MPPVKKTRIGKITIEVNRDLREMSGMTAKEKAQDLGLRIANHHAVAEKLEEVIRRKNINGTANPNHRRVDSQSARCR